MTERLCLLGHPIAHSKSPAMYNALYKRLGLDWYYDLEDCATDQQASDFLTTRDFLAINITTPYKTLAYDQANARAATAKLAGGANVLVNKQGTLIAYNTDGEGCVSFLEDQQVQFKEATVVVCGTGPTSLAILHAAALAGATKVVLLGRDSKRSGTIVQGYLDRLGELANATIDLPVAHAGWRTLKTAYDQVTFSYGSYESARSALASAHVIIDATPLGMNEGDKAPFDTKLLTADQVVLDVVYGHGTTALLEQAQKRGCRTFDGAGMLVAQAVITAMIQCETQGIDLDISSSEVFELMAGAAGVSF